MEEISNDGEEVVVWRSILVGAVRDKGLVLLSQGISYVIRREEEGWVLIVDKENQERALKELQDEEKANAWWKEEKEERVENKVGVNSVFLVALIWIIFGVIQMVSGKDWVERGMLDPEKVLKEGEWWRCLTALMLHGSVSHWLANLWAGLLFGWLVSIRVGAGVGWMLILLAGGVGNALNAYGYIGTFHRSIGASTAVFGALGLLVGDSLGDLWVRRRIFVWRRWVVPVGAGLGLLAVVGTGGEGGDSRVDVMAHGWGFLAGMLMGVGVPFVRVQAHGQKIVGMIAVVLMVVSWLFAWRV